MALVFLSIFAALAVAFYCAVDMNSVQAANYTSGNRARFAAEGGMSFMANKLVGCGVNCALRGTALLADAASKLGTSMNGTANLSGNTVRYDGTTVTVPTIASDGGTSFSAAITLAATDQLLLSVTGYGASAGIVNSPIQRTVSMNFQVLGNPAFSHGITSKGPITVSSNFALNGVTGHDGDGSMCSQAPGVAITADSGHVSGAVNLADPNASYSLGSTEVDGGVAHVPKTDLPPVDRSAYAAMATNTMSSAAPTAATYRNIRIPSNTNPTFNNNVTIEGVMYVEAPNHIGFNNNVNFVGVIVADDPPSGSPDSANYIYFKNNTNLLGSERLPDLAEFSDLKGLPGTAVLAPGFGLEFKNNFNAVEGSIAVKSLVAKNNLATTINGCVILYGDGGLQLNNNCSLTIDRTQYGYGAPPGFVDNGGGLKARPGTYGEH